MGSPFHSENGAGSTSVDTSCGYGAAPGPGLENSIRLLQVQVLNLFVQAAGELDLRYLGSVSVLAITLLQGRLSEVGLTACWPGTARRSAATSPRWG